MTVRPIRTKFAASLGFSLALALAVLAGCASPAPYAPRLSGQTTGYTDRELAQGRFRVTFTGNAATPRETVEDYLLLRAAQVTLAAGYTHFVFDSRDTKARTQYYADPLPVGPYGGYYGYWRFRPRWGYDPFGPDVEITASTRYEAFAEIVLLKPDQAAKEPRAVDARQIITHLSPPPSAPPAA
jgi:hypothetical protein